MLSFDGDQNKIRNQIKEGNNRNHLIKIGQNLDRWIVVGRAHSHPIVHWGEMNSNQNRKEPWSLYLDQEQPGPHDGAITIRVDHVDRAHFKFGPISVWQALWNYHFAPIHHNEYFVDPLAVLVHHVAACDWAPSTKLAIHAWIHGSTDRLLWLSQLEWHADWLVMCWLS